MRRFPIRIDERWRLLLALCLGATPERAWTTIDDTYVVARLGWFRMQIPTTEITRWRIEGPWRWFTAIGVRRSLRHGDVSFAGSTRGGVRLDLRRPTHWLVFDVPAFYVGVEDLEAFAAELSERGIPGADVRDADQRTGLPQAGKR